MDEDKNAENQKKYQNMLDWCIHDYMKKKNMVEAANIFANEANVEIDDPNMLNAPEGLLTDWWSMFYNTYNSGPQNNADPPGASTSMATGNVQQPDVNFVAQNVGPEVQLPKLPESLEINPTMLPSSSNPTQFFEGGCSSASAVPIPHETEIIQLDSDSESEPSATGAYLTDKDSSRLPNNADATGGSTYMATGNTPHPDVNFLALNISATEAELNLKLPAGDLSSMLSSSSNPSSMTSASWTPEQNKQFEDALAMYNKDDPDYWHNVARSVSGKSVDEVRLHYEVLEKDIMQIETGRVCIPDYRDNATNTIGYPNERRLRRFASGVPIPHEPEHSDTGISESDKSLPDDKL